MKTLSMRYGIPAALAALLAATLALSSSPSGGTRAAAATDGWAPLRVAGADEIENYTDVLQMRDASDLVVVGTFTSFTPGRAVIIPNALGDGIDDTLFWIDGHVQVEEIITTAGGLDLNRALDTESRVLTVEFFIGGAEEASHLTENVARLQASIGAGAIGRSVLFLRQPGSPRDPGPANPCTDWPADELTAFNMTPETCDAEQILAALGDTGPTGADAGLRLVWSYGLVASTANNPVDVPLGETPEEEQTSTDVHHHSGGQTLAQPLATWTTLDEFIAYLRT